MESRSPIFDKMWDMVLRKIRRTDAVHLEMVRSQSFSADKGNQKRGIGGKRVMHAFCSMCMAWHSGIHGRAEKIGRPDWAHGGLSHRSRELGLGCVLSNFDGTDAFGLTRRELHISTAQNAAKENDKMFAADSSTAWERDTASERRPCHADADGFHAGAEGL